MDDRRDKSGAVRDEAAVFEVAIGYGASPGAFKVDVISSPAGLASAMVSLDLNLLRARHRELQNSVLASSVSARRVTDELERPVREVGDALFTALLGTGEVAGRYRGSTALAAAGERALRVVLRIDVPELATLPWEAMYDQVTGAYVARRGRLVRNVPVAAPPTPVRVDLPLRILAVVSSPRDLQALDVERERAQLEEALSDLVAEGLVEVCWARSATWAGLQSKLMAGPWHVLHYIGHGDFDPQRDEGLLALTRSDGRADLVEASRFTDLLGEARPVPRVVVLNCCSGAAGSGSGLYSGTAAALVRAGVPAVVAMQYQVSDAASAEFTRGFYAAIAAGRGLDEATLSGRLAILGMSGHTLEWVTPILYLRSADTLLFIVPAAGEPAAIRPQPGRAAVAVAAADEGDQLRRRGHYDEAEKIYRGAIANDPGLAQAHAGLGAALYRLSKYSGAEPVLREAIRLNPADSWPHCDLGEVLRELGRRTEAEAEFEEALGLAPAHDGAARAWPLHHIGELRRGNGRLTDAAACFHEAISLNPAELWHHNEFAEALRGLGRHSEAEIEFREAIHLEPANPWPHHDLAIMLSDTERFAEAESEFREAARLHQDSPWPSYELGRMLSKLGRQDEAEAAFRTAIALEPSHPKPHLRLGDVLYQLGRHVEAEAEYRQVIALDPAIAEARDGLSKVLHATARPD